MIYAVMADLHANLEALECVLADARAQGAGEVVCLGDIVGYGPRPAETLARIRGGAALVVAGNHDDAVSGRMDAAGFIDLAGEAVSRHREALDAGALAYLRALPYTVEFGGAVAAHGEFSAPERFGYVEDPGTAADSFAVRGEQLMFVGHTHVPGIFLTGRSGRVYAAAPQDFTLEDGKRYIVNPGSVGYPREAHGECHSSYVLFDAEERSVRFRFLPFSVASVMQRGRAAPRRRRGRLAATVMVAAAVSGAAAWWLPRRAEPGGTPVAAAEDVATNATLAVDAAAKAVNPGLVLAPHACEVAVRVDFFGAGGAKLASTDAKTVKKRCTRADDFAVPRAASNAVEAVVQVLRKRPGDRPRFEQFQPRVVLKRGVR